MLKTKEWIRTIAICFFAVFLWVSTTSAARNNVIISEQNWTGSTVVCHVMKYVLEKKLDIPAQITLLNPAVTWAGMDKGDVDVFSDLWDSAQEDGIRKYVKEKKSIEMSLTFPNAAQGWFVPKYVVEQYGIKSIEDLKGKEVLFDIDQNGKGDLWVGPSSWKVAEQNKIRILSSGLNFQPVEVEQWAWLSTLKGVMQKKKPVIFYYWAPEWLFTQYDLHLIEEPPYDPAKWQWKEGDIENSKITCALRTSNVYVGYSAKLKNRLPKAYQFFKNWHLPVEEVNNLIAMVTEIEGQTKMSKEGAAKKWVEGHPEIVNSWLKGIK